MSTINEALKELRESYSDLPEDLDFENVEFFPGYEGEDEALDFIYLNDISDYNLVDDPKLGGFILYWNDSNTNESFDEVRDYLYYDDEVDDDRHYDDDAEDFDRRNVEAEKATIEAEAEKSIKESEEANDAHKISVNKEDRPYHRNKGSHCLDTSYEDCYIRKNTDNPKIYDVYGKDNCFIKGGFLSVNKAKDFIDAYNIDKVNESRLSTQEKDDIAKRAWMLNQVIWSMNDENAYSGSWLYLWPDETVEEDVKYYFNTRKDLKELEDLFVKIYKAYHEGGLYTDDEEIIHFAHDMDSKLGLKPIDVIPVVK